MPISQPFSERLKNWRSAHHLSQSQASERLGVSVRTFQDWEQARHSPRGFALKALLALVALPPKEK